MARATCFQPLGIMLILYFICINLDLVLSQSGKFQDIPLSNEETNSQLDPIHKSSSFGEEITTVSSAGRQEPEEEETSREKGKNKDDKNKDSSENKDISTLSKPEVTLSSQNETNSAGTSSTVYFTAVTAETTLSSDTSPKYVDRDYTRSDDQTPITETSSYVSESLAKLNFTTGEPNGVTTDVYTTKSKSAERTFEPEDETLKPTASHPVIKEILTTKTSYLTTREDQPDESDDDSGEFLAVTDAKEVWPSTKEHAQITSRPVTRTNENGQETDRTESITSSPDDLTTKGQDPTSGPVLPTRETTETSDGDEWQGSGELTLSDTTTSSYSATTVEDIEDKDRDDDQDGSGETTDSDLTVTTASELSTSAFPSAFSRVFTTGREKSEDLMTSAAKLGTIDNIFAVTSSGIAESFSSQGPLIPKTTPDSATVVDEGSGLEEIMTLSTISESTTGAYEISRKITNRPTYTTDYYDEGSGDISDKTTAQPEIPHVTKESHIVTTSETEEVYGSGDITGVATQGVDTTSAETSTSVTPLVAVFSTDREDWEDKMTSTHETDFLSTAMDEGSGLDDTTTHTQGTTTGGDQKSTVSERFTEVPKLVSTVYGEDGSGDITDDVTYIPERTTGAIQETSSKVSEKITEIPKLVTTVYDENGSGDITDTTPIMPETTTAYEEALGKVSTEMPQLVTSASDELGSGDLTDGLTDKLESTTEVYVETSSKVTEKITEIPKYITTIFDDEGSGEITDSTTEISESRTEVYEETSSKVTEVITEMPKPVTTDFDEDGSGDITDSTTNIPETITEAYKETSSKITERVTDMPELVTTIYDESGSGDVTDAITDAPVSTTEIYEPGSTVYDGGSGEEIETTTVTLSTNFTAEGTTSGYEDKSTTESEIGSGEEEFSTTEAGFLPVETSSTQKPTTRPQYVTTAETSTQWSVSTQYTSTAVTTSGEIDTTIESSGEIDTTVEISTTDQQPSTFTRIVSTQETYTVPEEGSGEVTGDITEEPTTESTFETTTEEGSGEGSGQEIMPTTEEVQISTSETVTTTPLLVITTSSLPESTESTIVPSTTFSTVEPLIEITTAIQDTTVQTTAEVTTITPETTEQTTPVVTTMTPETTVQTTPEVTTVEEVESTIQTTPEITTLAPETTEPTTPEITTLPPETTVQTTPEITTLAPETTVQTTPEITTLPLETTVQTTPEITTQTPEITVQTTPEITTQTPETTVQTTQEITTLAPETTVQTTPEITTLPPETTAQTTPEIETTVPTTEAIETTVPTTLQTTPPETTVETTVTTEITVPQEPVVTTTETTVQTTTTETTVQTTTSSTSEPDTTVQITTTLESTTKVPETTTPESTTSIPLLETTVVQETNDVVVRSKFKISEGLNWEKGLDDKDSMKYRNTVNKVKPKVLRVINEMPKSNREGFKGVNNMSFSRGSVVVEFDILFHPNTTVDQQQFGNSFKETMLNSPNFANYTLDEDSFEFEVIPVGGVTVPTETTSGPMAPRPTSEAQFPGWAIGLVLAGALLLIFFVLLGIVLCCTLNKRRKKQPGFLHMHDAPSSLDSRPTSKSGSYGESDGSDMKVPLESDSLHRLTPPTLRIRNDIPDANPETNISTDSAANADNRNHTPSGLHIRTDIPANRPFERQVPLEESNSWNSYLATEQINAISELVDPADILVIDETKGTRRPLDVTAKRTKSPREEAEVTLKAKPGDVTMKKEDQNLVIFYVGDEITRTFYDEVMEAWQTYL